MNNKPIGIFDSGVGGFTVYKQIRKELPNENVIYLGDTKNFPYGNKSKEDIIKFAIENTKILINKGVKLIIIACGTVTSQAIDVLQEKFDIPIIGIIEPTIQYIKEQNIKEIGVMATEGTIRSNAWENNLKKCIEDIKVINKACPILATIAEQGKAESIEGRKAIKEYMGIFKKNRINKIILGCTHYPIYEKIIREELVYEVELIDTGTTVSRYVKKFLIEKTMMNSEDNCKETIYLTKPEKEFKNIAKDVMGIDIKINNL